MRKLQQHRITKFGVPGNCLVDSGGEFANKEFITFCGNVINIRICITTGESLWSKRLVERH